MPIVPGGVRESGLGSWPWAVVLGRPQLTAPRSGSGSGSGQSSFKVACGGTLVRGFFLTLLFKSLVSFLTWTFQMCTTYNV